MKLLVEAGASPALANERNYVPLDLANFNDKTDVSDYFLSFLPSLEKKHEEAGLKNAVESTDLSGDGEEDVIEEGKAKDEKSSSS